MNSWERVIFYLTIFISGMSTMGIELSASRLLAPFFGSSLFVWTNIIGTIMISLSIGYYLGGRYADKYPNLTRFYALPLVAGILLGIIPLTYSMILPAASQALMSSSYNDFLLSFIGSVLLFAFPALFLGCIIPYALRISMQSIKEIGSKSGRIYAISTVGSIVGVYLPSILLIPTVGTRNTIVSLAFLLILTSSFGLILSILKTVFKKSLLLVFIIFIIISILCSSSLYTSPNSSVVYEIESPYNYLQVRKEGKSTYLLGKEYGGVWSKICEGNFFTGEYWDYHLVSSALVNDLQDVLILGLGAGTTARSFSAAFPNISIDGVEIDPVVIEIGKRYFDMDNLNLNTIISDGRVFLRSTQKRYDVIVVDAYRDVYIPQHMVTVEFFNEIKHRLKEDGVLSINVVEFYKTELVDAVGNTMLQVFSKVFFVKIPFSSNYILFGTNTNLNLEEIKIRIIEKRDNLNFSSKVSKDDALTLKVVFSETYVSLKEFHLTDGIIFTDDNAPVEQIVGLRAFFP